MIIPLNDFEMESATDELEPFGWSFDHSDRTLRRKFTFDNFIEAFGWMAEAAMEAEKMNHHPEWYITYNTVTVNLSTISAGGISIRDLELARKMNAI